MLCMNSFFICILWLQVSWHDGCQSFTAILFNFAFCFVAAFSFLAFDCQQGQNVMQPLICMGGEVGFDTASSLFIKYSAGVALNKSDFSAALLMYVYMKLNVCFR